MLNATSLVQPLYDGPIAMTVIDREIVEVSTAVSTPELLRPIAIQPLRRQRD